MSDINFSIDEELPIILLKECELKYKRLSCLYDEMESNTQGLIITTIWVAVEKCDVVFGHLAKGKTGRFAKTISFFLRGGKESPCKVTGKWAELGNGEGLEMPCKPHFTGDAKYLDKLTISYGHYCKYVFFILISSIFSS